MAHKIISTSEHLNIRQKNLPQRITKIKEALQIGNWRELYLLVKEESLCMHRLFTSSSPSFSYYSVENEKIFEYVELIWNTMHDGPLITMDAGPNVHLLYRKSQTKLAKFIKKNIQVKWI
jgi:diphosphomevalonate decarboxylase